MRWAFYRESGGFLERDNSPRAGRNHSAPFLRRRTRASRKPKESLVFRKKLGSGSSVSNVAAYPDLEFRSSTVRS